METEQVLEQQEPMAQPGEGNLPEEMAPVEEGAASAAVVEEIDPDVADALKDLGLEPEIKGRVSKKILKEISKRKAAEDKAREEAEEKARWRDEVYRRDAMQQTTVTPEITIDTSDLPVPTREAFDHDEDAYQAAIAERAAVVAYRREKARERQQEMTQQQIQQGDTKAKWGQEGRKKFADFDVVYTVTITDPMGSAIMGNERGHEVAYFLGKNPQEAERISRMHPVDQSIEIQRIARKLANAQPKTNTTAPTATSPMGDREIVTKPVDIRDPNISFKDYEKLRMKQLRERAGGL